MPYLADIDHELVGTDNTGASVRDVSVAANVHSKQR